MEELFLPKDFKMGSATAALQIEGGDRNNNWYDWCEKGRIKDGSHCVVATDHWNLYEQDIAIMKELNHDTYRMGIEWSRLEPERGQFSEEAVNHYRNEITKLLDNGIHPIVTLHHFSHPLWLEDQGGWEDPKVINEFKRFTQFVVEKLGDLVTDWITINEPNVFVIYGYLHGTWPPGKNNMGSMFKALRNMIMAHIESYQLVHQIRKERAFPGETLVGVANHLRIFDPVSPNIINKAIAHLPRYISQDIILEGMITGKLKFPLGFGGYPLGKGKYCDFLGINYYSRDMVRFTLDPKKAFAELSIKENAPVNDLGWEIYPNGLYRLCKYYNQKYPMPIFITENGICDENDSKRTQFIYDHLLEIRNLIRDGIPVQRYYHWTLIDNFEWLEGEKARFGLVHNDYPTQTRTIRKSGRFYGAICREKAITTSMIEQYLKP